jgi:membrane-bound lytic murein transglycosylase
MLSKILENSSFILLSSLFVSNIILVNKNNKDNIRNNKDNIQNKKNSIQNNKDSIKNNNDGILNKLNEQKNIEAVMDDRQYLSRNLVISEENFEKIKVLPEINTSWKSTKFRDIFFEKYINHDNKKYLPIKYYNVLSDLENNGLVDNDYNNRCELLYDWVDCYNSNHKLTESDKRIAYIFGGNKCSVKIY